MLTKDVGTSNNSLTGRPMKACTYTLKLESTCAPEFIDITDRAVQIISESQVEMGFAVIYSTHTTAAIKINENEPLLMIDMANFLERISPRNGAYGHNDFSIRTVNMTEDECPNGHAHCQHLVLSASEMVPIVNGQLTLGKWQRIFMLELDRPRAREVIIQVLGV